MPDIGAIDMRSVLRVTHLWSHDHHRSAITTQSVEGQVPKQNIGLMGYCRQTDCPAGSGQLVMSGNLVEI